MANNGQATVYAPEAVKPPIEGKFAKTSSSKEVPPLMSRINEKAAQDITLKRGTLWFIGTAIALLSVVFVYGSSMLGWVRDDETQRIKLSNVERQIEELRGEVKTLTTLLQDMKVKEAETRGYKLGSIDSGHNETGKEKK